MKQPFFIGLLVMLVMAGCAHPRTESNKQRKVSAPADTVVQLDTFAIRLGLDKPLPASYVSAWSSVVLDSRYCGHCMEDFLGQFSFVSLKSVSGPDLMLSTNHLAEGYFTFLFKRDDDYALFYERIGRFSEILPDDSVMVLFDEACCAGTTENYVFVSLTGEAFHDSCIVYSWIHEPPVPNAFCVAEIVTDSAVMHYEPLPSDSLPHFYFEMEGNIIARFPKQSQAVVLSFETDSLGQEWAFLITDRAPYENTHYWYPEEHVDAYYAGWVSRNDLVLTEDKEVDWPKFLYAIRDYRRPYYGNE